MNGAHEGVDIVIERNEGHGLRASELCDLQWSQVELASGRLHVRRAKNGSPSVHPMQGDEIRAAASASRTGAILVRFYGRAGPAYDAQSLPCGIRSDRGSRQNAVSDPTAHDARRLPLRPGQRRPLPLFGSVTDISPARGHRKMQQRLQSAVSPWARPGGARDPDPAQRRLQAGHGVPASHSQ